MNLSSSTSVHAAIFTDGQSGTYLKAVLRQQWGRSSNIKCHRNERQRQPRTPIEASRIRCQTPVSRDSDGEYDESEDFDESERGFA